MGVRGTSLGRQLGPGLMGTFTWWGRPFRYHDHPYNTTALNERAVELPIAFRWLDQRQGRGLEVGNVTGHYQPGRHRVVDLHEHADGVDNVDVFDVEGVYDWVLAISTVEHVRWDPPEEQQPGGGLAAIWHLEGLLSPGGQMLVTVPLGHNPPLDAAILAGETGAARACTFVRAAAGGWVQTAEPAHRPYGATTKWAESVWIGEWR